MKTVIGRLGQLGLIGWAAVSLAAEVPLAQRQARVSPQWLTQGILYQVWLRGLTPEGTLKAATGRLPKVAELGATVVYLSPVCLQDDDMRKEHWSPRQRKTDNPKNPYRIKDYFEVDPEYGTKEDLHAFVKEAHRLGLRVLMDMVYVHCGPTAKIIAEHPDFLKRNKDGSLKLAQWGFPAIDFANPALREYFWKNLEYWVKDFDVDGFRCDVADGIPLAFWETARERLEKIRPDIGILAEGLRKEDQLKAFDLDYGWGYDGKWSDAGKVRAQWERMAAERPCGGAKFARFIENHDIVQDAGTNRFDKAWGVRHVDAVLVALFTLDGVPFLYNGQEVAETARQSLYAKWPADWAHGETPEGQARFALCQKLCKLRRTERALKQGSVEWLDNDAPVTVLSFLRKSGSEQILTVVNLKDSPVAVRIERRVPAESAVTLLNCGVKGVESKGEALLLTLDSAGYWAVRL
jgi:glycosidase